MTVNWKEFVGEMSDREVSRRFDVSSSTVRRYRLQQCMPPHNPRDVVIPAGLPEKLAIGSNYQLTKEFNISASRVETLRAELCTPEPRLVRPRFVPLEEGVWTEEAIALLGTMSDPELGDRLGVSRTPVKKSAKSLALLRIRHRSPRLRLKLLPSSAKSPTVSSPSDWGYQRVTYVAHV